MVVLAFLNLLTWAMFSPRSLHIISIASKRGYEHTSEGDLASWFLMFQNQLQLEPLASFWIQSSVRTILKQDFLGGILWFEVLII